MGRTLCEPDRGPTLTVILAGGYHPSFDAGSTRHAGRLHGVWDVGK
jgi:hypothetical protein